MTTQHRSDNKNFLFWLGASTFLLPVLFFLSKHNYLLSHSVVEVFSILTGFPIFLYAVSSFPFNQNPVIMHLGILYLGVIIAFPHRKWYLPFVFAVTLFGVLGIASVFQGYFLDCFVEGRGLTFFKVGSEYVMIFLLLGLLLKVWRTENYYLLPFRTSLIWALLLSAAGEFSFTLYQDVYGFFNILGHLFRFLSYVIILRGIVVECLKKPFHALVGELVQEKEKFENLAKRDPLTGLFNRYTFEEWIKRFVNQHFPLQTYSLVFIDINNFKEINDSFGHQVGDKVLVALAKILTSRLRQEVVIFRYGGDEFLAVFPQTSPGGARFAIERARNEFVSL